jgi:AcrR family transcriptional regulator
MARADAPAVGSAEWWDARSRRRAPLTEGRIVAAALALVEAEGADALTMRRLSDVLDTAPASLYRHIESRDALLLLVSEAIIAEVTIDDDEGAPWQERIAGYAYAVRRALERHPARAELCLGPQAPGPQAYSVFQRGIGVFLDAGFSPELAMAAGQAIVFLVVSFVAQEATWPENLVVTPMTLVPADGDRFAAARRVDGAGSESPADELFDFLLGGIIESLERRLSATRT